MKISKEKRDKISEQILLFLYNSFPTQPFTAEIARELARDEEFIKKLLVELKEKGLVQKAILEEAQRICQHVEAIAVCANHVHLAARACDKSIEQIVSMYKSAATRTLRSNNRQGKIWTKSFDKRFCFTEEDFKKKIVYIQKHNV